MHGKKEGGACIIGHYCGVMCCDHERRGCGFADVVVWRMSDLLGPIKLKATRVI